MANTANNTIQTENQRAKRIPLGKDVSTVRRAAKTRRHLRLRKKVVGTTERPRLVVNRSSRHLHAQIVDDSVGRTLAAASSIEAVVFDRGGHDYHGRIAALADAAREAGLRF